MEQNRCYTELMQIPTFEKRFEYLKLDGSVGQDTFGFDRYLNQIFYKSPEWKKIRNAVIARDNGCDMAHEDYPIGGRILIHHMNPIRMDDIVNRAPWIMDPEFLVCVSHATHNAIHYGDASQIEKGPTIRRANDTCPWKH